MRQLCHGDLTSAARALLAEADRARAVQRMLDHAHAADRFRKKTGRCHPCWGNGTLAAAAQSGILPSEPYLSDPDYLACLGEVIAGVGRWRRRRCE